jgi:ribosomal protein S13
MPEQNIKLELITENFGLGKNHLRKIIRKVGINTIKPVFEIKASTLKKIEIFTQNQCFNKKLKDIQFYSLDLKKRIGLCKYKKNKK